MPKSLNIHLLIIDPENDFIGMADGSPYTVKTDESRVYVADLPVKGAYEDMGRIATLIRQGGSRFADIHVTIDSHRTYDVGHASMWIGQDGKRPLKFQVISADDIEKGIWSTRDPRLRSRMLEYARKLESTPDHYKIMIWSDIGHCLIGTWGQQVFPAVNDALQEWSMKYTAMVNYVTKGSNPYVEHYGALAAEVPDPSDPKTGLNGEFLALLERADIIVVCGEAASHCVAKTVRQISENIGSEHIKKFKLLSDCMSSVIHPVIDFPAVTKKFFDDMQHLGMTVTTSTEFMS